MPDPVWWIPLAGSLVAAATSLLVVLLTGGMRTRARNRERNQAEDGAYRIKILAMGESMRQALQEESEQWHDRYVDLLGEHEALHAEYRGLLAQYETLIAERDHLRQLLGGPGR